VTELASFAENKITSLSQFVSNVSALHKRIEAIYASECGAFDPGGKDILVYRGHCNCNFELKARIFRKDSGFDFSKDESLVYNETLHNYPDYFQKENDIIDNLIRMQHYDIPTRLIDLTFNPMVALFFACGGYDSHPVENNSHDGEVLVFFCKQRTMSFSKNLNQLLLIGVTDSIIYDSIHSMLITPIIKFLKFINEQKSTIISPVLLRKIDELSDKIYDELKTCHSSYTLTRNLIRSIEFRIQAFFTYFSLKSHSDMLDHMDIDLLHKFDDTLSNIVCQFIENVSKDWNLNVSISQFQDHYYSLVEQFVQGTIIRPIMNNERIKRQHGAFLLHSPVYHDVNLIDKNILRGEDVPITHMIIDNKSKSNILKELEQNGITYSFLFPELDKYNREIKRKITLRQIKFTWGI